MSTLPESEPTSDKPQTRNVPKIEAGMATAEHIRKDWEARGCPNGGALARLFEIDGNPALANDPELIKELQCFTGFLNSEGMKVNTLMAEKAFAASLTPPDAYSSFVAVQESIKKIWQDDAWRGQSAKMALALADLDSNSTQASAAAAIQAIAAYVPPPCVEPSFVAAQASIAKMLQDDRACMGRCAEMAFELQAESLKAEEVWKTFEQVAGFQTVTRIIKEMSSAESLYGFSAVEALHPRYMPVPDVGLAALCGIGSSKATAARSRPVQDRSRQDRTQPQIILTLETTTSATTGNSTVVHWTSCSVSTAFVVALPPPPSVPDGEDKILRRMLTEGNASAVVAHLRHQMGVRPKKRGRPAIKRELYA